MADTTAAPDAGTAALTAARIELTDAIRAALEDEAAAAQYVLRARGDFPGWIATYFRGRPTALTSALAPACRAMTAAGVRLDAGVLAQKMTDRSRTELTIAYSRLGRVRELPLFLDGYAERETLLHLVIMG